MPGGGRPAPSPADYDDVLFHEGGWVNRGQPHYHDTGGGYLPQIMAKMLDYDAWGGYPTQVTTTLPKPQKHPVPRVVS